jgi:acyl-homoserine-lactone acylase
MKKLLLPVVILLFAKVPVAQLPVNPQTIDIVRDSFGVPHIFAPTDAAVAYGLAWANAEDDFKTIQQSFLAAKSMLGLYSGKKGALIDYVGQLIRAKQLVNEKYEADISPQFKAVLQGYSEGFNAYAKKNPHEVLVKKAFPIAPKDLLTYCVLQLFISCGGDKALQRIYAGSTPTLQFMNPGGSNSFAFNSHKTADGQVYLNINSHQPLQGPVSWYEAQLCSEEGWNIVGALFPGAPIILTGANEYLGWGHTVNNPDKLDVFQLEINPANKLQYKFDGKWEQLEESTARLQVKVAGVGIAVKRKMYWSKYGPTVIAKNGTFSIRTPALFTIKALEQWYWMNKAKNFTEFYTALKMEAIPGYNVVYADRYDTIFYISNGIMPYRDKAYNWKRTVPGNTSKTLWTQFHPITDLPQVLNPSSGYLFNSNHSPFNATAAADNIKKENYDATMGYETLDNNRSIRFMQLIDQYKQVSYEDFKRIKYDLQLPEQLAYPINADTLFLLNEKEYPEIADLVTDIKQWDRKASTDSKGAALFSIALYYIAGRIQKDWSSLNALNKSHCVEIYNYIKNYLALNFNNTPVTLGEYQRLVRGTKSIPLPGIPDVIASMASEPYQKGQVKGYQGESYIELVRFTKEGPVIESINCYGASNRAGARHYDDQMELFVHQHTKKMSLRKEDIYKAAENIYHPL